MFFFSFAFPCITDKRLSVDQPMAPSGFSVLDATVVSEAKRHSNTGIELLCPGTASLMRSYVLMTMLL